MCLHYYAYVCGNGFLTSEVIAVGAVKINKKITTLSSRSDKISVYAPGYKVKTIVDNSIVEFSGTSAATPFVTCLVAIIKTIDHTLNFNEINSIIEDSADKVIQNNKTIRIINYKKAIHLAIGGKYDKK